MKIISKIKDIIGDIRYNLARLIPRRIKWFIQRGRNGWAECDTWNLDTYICEVLSGLISHMRDNLTGYPAGLALIKEVPCKEEEYKSEINQWKKILDEMIWAFEFMENIADSRAPYCIDKKGNIDYKMIIKSAECIGTEKVPPKEDYERYIKAMRLFSVCLPYMWD